MIEGLKFAIEHKLSVSEMKIMGAVLDGNNTSGKIVNKTEFRENNVQILLKRLLMKGALEISGKKDKFNIYIVHANI